MCVCVSAKVDVNVYLHDTSPALDFFSLVLMKVISVICLAYYWKLFFFYFCSPIIDFGEIVNVTPSAMLRVVEYLDLISLDNWSFFSCVTK